MAKSLAWSRISQLGKPTNSVFLFLVNVWAAYCVFHWQVRRGKDVYDHGCPSMTLVSVLEWDLFLTWVYLCGTGAPQAALTGRASWLASRLATFGFTPRCVSQQGRTRELLPWTSGCFKLCSLQMVLFAFPKKRGRNGHASYLFSSRVEYCFLHSFWMKILSSS